MSERDPRVDPQPGDIIRRHGTTEVTRMVRQVHPRYRRMLFDERIAYSRKATEAREGRESSVRQWQNWAATATVIRRADGTGKRGGE